MQTLIASTDPERLFSVLGVITVLSLLVERALSVAFESRKVNDWVSKRALKEPIAVAVSLGVCMHWQIDAITALVSDRPAVFWGELVTAVMIAGGNKASIKLFQDVLGTMSNTERARRAHRGAGPEGTANQPSAVPPTPPSSNQSVPVTPAPAP